MSFEIAFNPPQFLDQYDGTKMRQLVEELERLHAALTSDVDDEGEPGFITTFNGRTGDVVPIQADYDSFFLTPAEGDSAYLRLDGANDPVTGNVTINAALDVNGALTATTYGGIAEANLLDKTALETVTGGWTFSGTLSIPQQAVIDHEAAIDHDALTNFVSQEHIRWDLTGAEDIHVDRITSAAVTQHEAAIDHDALTNFVAAEHIDWSAVGVEDIDVGRITSAAVTQHEAAINHDALTNFVVQEHIRWDLTGAEDVHSDRISQASVTQHEAAINHDALTNFVAAEHIDWSAVGVEDIDAGRITSAAVTQHEAAIDHDALTNFVAQEHIRWDLTGAEDVHVDRISETAVTQHEAALTIANTQITGLSSDDLSDVASIAMLNENESVSGEWTFNDLVVVNGRLQINPSNLTGVNDLDALPGNGFFSWTTSVPSNADSLQYAQLLQLDDGVQDYQWMWARDGGNNNYKMALRRADGGVFAPWQYLTFAGNNEIIEGQWTFDSDSGSAPLEVNRSVGDQRILLFGDASANWIQSESPTGNTKSLILRATTNDGGTVGTSEPSILMRGRDNVTFANFLPASVTLGNYVFDIDQTVGAGQDGYVLTYDDATGFISLEAATGGSGAANDDGFTRATQTVTIPAGGALTEIKKADGTSWASTGDNEILVRAYIASTSTPTAVVGRFYATSGGAWSVETYFASGLSSNHLRLGLTAGGLPGIGHYHASAYDATVETIETDNNSVFGDYYSSLTRKDEEEVIASEWRFDDGIVIDPEAGGRLLQFLTDRPWSFREISSGATSALGLRAEVDSKQFRIENIDGNALAVFTASSVASSHALTIYDSAETDSAKLYHDGTDFNIELTNASFLSITGAANGVDIDSQYRINGNRALTQSANFLYINGQNDFTSGIYTGGDMQVADVLRTNTLRLDNLEKANVTSPADGHFYYDANTSASDDDAGRNQGTTRRALKLYDSTDGWGVIVDTWNMEETWGEFLALGSYEGLWLTDGLAKTADDWHTIVRPKGAAYDIQVGSQTGIGEIRLPKVANTMVAIRIVGYDYNTNVGYWEIHVGGYTYDPGTARWERPSVHCLGNPPFNQVQLVTHDSTDTQCIWLGETTTNWDYQKFHVQEVHVGHANQSIENWRTGWSTQMLSSTTGYTVNATRAITRQSGDGFIYPSGQGSGYIGDVTGQYGSIQVNGADGSSGTWEGLSIGGRIVLMDNAGTATSNRGGLFDDTNNHWVMQYNTAGTGNYELTLYANNSATLVLDGVGADIQSGKELRIQDSGNDDWGFFQHSGSVFEIGTVGTGAGDVPIEFTQTGNVRMRIHDTVTTGETSYGEIADHLGTMRDIGFNVLPVQSEDVSDTLEAKHNGGVFFKDGTTARTLTLEASTGTDFPVHGVCTIINAGTSGNITVSEGSGTTLYVLTGSGRTDAAGSATVAAGSVATLWREATNIYYLFGNGVTP